MKTLQAIPKTTCKVQSRSFGLFSQINLEYLFILQFSVQTFQESNQ